MTEDEARDRVAALVGDGAAIDRLTRLVALVADENERQNLVSRSTLASIWHRHILDSVQLVPLAADGRWIDVGTGGGFPGLAVAAASERPVVLVEPRTRRAAFLRASAETLGLSHVSVEQARVERVSGAAATITARAVATPDVVVATTVHLADTRTRWLLQRGATWQDDLSALRRQWKGVFHVEQSIANDDGRIIVASGVAHV